MTGEDEWWHVMTAQSPAFFYCTKELCTKKRNSYLLPHGHMSFKLAVIAPFFYLRNFQVKISNFSARSKSELLCIACVHTIAARGWDCAMAKDFLHAFAVNVVQPVQKCKKLEVANVRSKNWARLLETLQIYWLIIWYKMWSKWKTGNACSRR